MTIDAYEPTGCSLIGSLDASKIRDGVPRGLFGAWQRRVRPSVMGEPAYKIELVPETVCSAQPHIWAYDAWEKMERAAAADGISVRWLAIHSAYRSVALQEQIFHYRLEERRQNRVRAGLPKLSEKELRRLQQKWTAAPGRSAHHTGFALDFALYHLGVKEGRKSEAWKWLMLRAREFHFYPYLEEPWHWEYNPPGLVDALRTLREALSRRRPYTTHLRPEFLDVHLGS